MSPIPDLRMDRTSVGSFDKDIPGIPSSRLTIEQDGLHVRLTDVGYENDCEIGRSVYEGTLAWWFPGPRVAFVRMVSRDGWLRIEADTGVHRCDLTPDELLADGVEGVGF